MTLEARH